MMTTPEPNHLVHPESNHVVQPESNHLVHPESNHLVHPTPKILFDYLLKVTYPPDILNYDYLFDHFESRLNEACEQIKIIRSDEKFPCNGYYEYHAFYVLFGKHFCDNMLSRYLFNAMSIPKQKIIIKKEVWLDRTGSDILKVNHEIDIQLLRTLIVKKNPNFFMKMLNHVVESGTSMDSEHQRDSSEESTKPQIKVPQNLPLQKMYNPGSHFTHEKHINDYKGLAEDQLRQCATDTSLTVLDILETYPLFGNPILNRNAAIDNISPSLMPFVEEINEYIADENYDAFTNACYIYCRDCGTNNKFYYFLDIFDNISVRAPWKNFKIVLPCQIVPWQLKNPLHDFIFGENPVCPHAQDCICEKGEQLSQSWSMTHLNRCSNTNARQVIKI